MNDYFLKAPIRIPVKLVDGHWELLYGGTVPVRSDTVGDLVVDKSRISDPTFLKLLTRPSKHKILKQGEELLVALTIRPDQKIEDAPAKHLIAMSDIVTELSLDFHSTGRSEATQFVRVNIGAPTDIQKASGIEEGGLWLRVEGIEPKGVSSSSVEVPSDVSAKPLDSLNHAFTKLSEVFEPWRKSHTGNIYTRVLYRESDNKWYPLDVLRRTALVKGEHDLIAEHRAEIAKTLDVPQSPRSPT